jgi:hypothetical protein
MSNRSISLTAKTLQKMFEKQNYIFKDETGSQFTGDLAEFRQLYPKMCQISYEKDDEGRESVVIKAAWAKVTISTAGINQDGKRIGLAAYFEADKPVFTKEGNAKVVAYLQHINLLAKPSKKQVRPYYHLVLNLARAIQEASTAVFHLKSFDNLVKRADKYGKIVFDN